ncbi:MAG: hypothetical protein HRT89_14015, partial [Lentisphaeria bacterium]|nr:hypothetical protein [Lentisphaeria bacterium]NQZ69171.1 hypothetical protein [Lentisphaeria bacterium]
MSTDTIKFDNGFELSLATDGSRFLGITDVVFDGSALRNPTLPWILYAQSDTGHSFDNFSDLQVNKDGDWTVLEFNATGSWMPMVEETDMMTDPMIRTRRLKSADAKVRWKLRPITEQIEENEWCGLAMQLEIDCPGHPIHWLLEDTTWEIGGAAEGAVLVQQDM